VQATHPHVWRTECASYGGTEVSTARPPKLVPMEMRVFSRNGSLHIMFVVSVFNAHVESVDVSVLVDHGGRLSRATELY
jgi:hypothetical protein